MGKQAELLNATSVAYGKIAADFVAARSSMRTADAAELQAQAGAKQARAATESLNLLKSNARLTTWLVSATVVNALATLGLVIEAVVN